MPRDSLQHVSVGNPFPLTEADGTSFPGDTWAPAWMKDGIIVTPANDTQGIRQAGSSNLNFNHLTGSSLDQLTGKTVSIMPDFGGSGEKGPDDCTWKSSGCLALDGVLYWFIARHWYGQDSGDPHMRQPAHGGTILKSCDQGKTWTPSARECYDQPMFPGSRFAAAFFINYGQDGREAAADGSDQFVYATSNNGFWDNGDDMILARVLRSALPNLSPMDWQYFTGGDGNSDSAWTSNVGDAALILNDPDRLGSTGAVYLHAHECYLMITWGYPAGGGKLPGACTTTYWTFYTSPRPWGPWSAIGSHTFTPQGFYCPAVCPKFTSADGSKLTVFTAGDWNNPEVYRLTAVPITVS